MENLQFKNVEIIDGFWKHRYDLNRKVSLKAVYERFEETGRFDAVRYNFREGKPFPHIFFDSDVAKWIEAVGYLIINEGGGYEEEQKVIDEVATISAETWFALSRWAKETNNFQSWQRSLLFSVGSLIGRGQKPSIKQATHAIKAYHTAKENSRG